MPITDLDIELPRESRNQAPRPKRGLKPWKPGTYTKLSIMYYGRFFRQHVYSQFEIGRWFSPRDISYFPKHSAGLTCSRVLMRWLFETEDGRIERRRSEYRIVRKF